MLGERVLTKLLPHDTKSLALTSLLTALGVALAPFLWFPFLTTRAFPIQHMINAIGAILLGPIWAMIIAVLVGTIRNILGIGTLYAFPGGVPGALVVGLIYLLTRRSKNRFLSLSAAFFEPVGTVFIGATIARYVVAPLIGDPRLLGTALAVLWSGWAVSSITGAIIGYVLLLALARYGFKLRR